MTTQNLGNKFFAVYMNDVQPKLTLRKVSTMKWFDWGVAYFFAISLLCLLMKMAGESLAAALLHTHN